METLASLRNQIARTAVLSFSLNTGGVEPERQGLGFASKT